jgi:hypothetical protein
MHSHITCHMNLVKYNNYQGNQGVNSVSRKQVIYKNTKGEYILEILIVK